MAFFYNIGILLFGFAIQWASLFNSKARSWTTGRRNWETKLKNKIEHGNDLIWMHCSSLGEFEQGRPIIEALAAKGEKVLLTFFSPSGYEVRKDYASAYFVSYLPLDTPGNAKKWMEIIQPKCVLFVKYEFWYNFIRETNKKKIPLFLVSGIFRKDQYFFKWYGGWGVRHLKMFQHFFVQDENSFQLLKKIGIQQVSVAGDTRFDRVEKIASSTKKLDLIEQFSRASFCLVAGSTWPEDEDMLLTCLRNIKHMKMVLAPHEISRKHLEKIKDKWNDHVSFYSEHALNADSRLLIVDVVGVLSNVYRYGQLAYIGGGFGKGIHNTLEAAVYGMPILFGPNFLKFREAREMVQNQGAFPVKNTEELMDKISDLENEDVRGEAAIKNRNYVKTNVGATDQILKQLAEKRIL